MANLRIVCLAAGPNDALHTQSQYSMLSALAWGNREQRIHLHTDAPARYRSLAEIARGQIEIEAIANIEPGRIFEAKLTVIRNCAQRFSGDAILFCDADTFFVRPYEDLHERILSGEFFLHRREYDVARHPTPQMRKFRRSLCNAGLDEEGAMWNSGVVGLPPGRASVLGEALKIYARLNPHTKKKYLAEQHSVSLALSLSGLIAPAEDWIFHYWYQKADYTHAIQDRLTEWQGKSLAQMSTELRADRIVLLAPAAKLHWWEKLLTNAGLKQKPPEIRGLPK